MWTVRFLCWFNTHNEDFGFWHFWKRSNFEALFRPSTLKTENLSNKFNGSIRAYRVFYLPIFRRIKGGGGILPPPSGPCGTVKIVVLWGLRTMGLILSNSLKLCFRFEVEQGNVLVRSILFQVSDITFSSFFWNTWDTVYLKVLSVAAKYNTWNTVYLKVLSIADKYNT